VPEQAVSPPSGARSRLTGLRAPAFACVLTVGVGASPGTAAAHAPTTAAAGSGSVHCTVEDPRLAELSGLVVIGTRLLALNDGGDQLAVHVLDSGCAVTETRSAAVDPYDPEDLALSADGVIWVADIGDNNGDRETVALHAMHPGGDARLYRLSYPDGPHDAEALLLSPDGTPYIVTKEILGSSGVYRPVSDLTDGATVGMEKVATVNVTLTGTPGGPVGRAGQLMITGGAVSGDGALLALRTYTDAYLWRLEGSDVPRALAAEPVQVPLPESPQGEAISFAEDDRGLVVASEGLPSDVVVVDTHAALEPVADSLLPTGGAGTGTVEETRSPFTSGIIAAGVATIVVWLGSLFRRRRD
jgi:hypothetical protein